MTVKLGTVVSASPKLLSPSEQEILEISLMLRIFLGFFEAANGVEAVMMHDFLEFGAIVVVLFTIQCELTAVLKNVS